MARFIIWRRQAGHISELAVICTVRFTITFLQIKYSFGEDIPAGIYEGFTIKIA